MRRDWGRNATFRGVVDTLIVINSSLHTIDMPHYVFYLVHLYYYSVLIMPGKSGKRRLMFHYITDPNLVLSFKQTLTKDFNQLDAIG